MEVLKRQQRNYTSSINCIKTIIPLPPNRKNLKKKLIILAAITLFPGYLFAQLTPTLDNQSLLGQRNVITTSVPFLLISPDSRAAGMGDMGVASPGDVNSIHWNPAKLAFIDDQQAGLSLSGAPWLRTLVPDVWFYHLSGYAKIGDGNRSAVAASLRYFTLGDIQFTDPQGQPLGNYEPKEFAIDGAYATQLTDHFSLGIALRFIFSDLARGQTGVNGALIKAGIAGAGDISAFYKNEADWGTGWRYGIGLNISNIGNKITYTDEAHRDFIPTNLRLGTFWETDIDEYNTIGFGIDFNKLLVPSPTYILDSNDNIIGREVADVPVITGMLQSFGDAPAGFREEMREITISAGVEYWYAEQFALRAGYFFEHDTKGAREYLTFGAGLKYNVFRIDAAYLQPFTRRHPLQNTIRFSLLFDIQAFSEQNNS